MSGTKVRQAPVESKASYWLSEAANALDCAVQCCGTEESAEIDKMEGRCDELAQALKSKGN